MDSNILPLIANKRSDILWNASTMPTWQVAVAPAVHHHTLRSKSWCALAHLWHTAVESNPVAAERPLDMPLHCHVHMCFNTLRKASQALCRTLSGSSNDR